MSKKMRLNKNIVNIGKKLYKFWDYVWNGDDLLSWILSLLFAFIIIKFIFYPVVGVLLATTHPIVAVVSGSMEHHVSDAGLPFPMLCGKSFSEQERLSFDEYWTHCGDWYENNTDITKSKFKKYHFKNGMNIGDIIVLRNPGPENINIGDVIVFIQEQNPAKEPIIHRVVSIDNSGAEIVFQTKGDHNKESIKVESSAKYLNEYEVTESQLVGRALFRVPYLGYLKIWFYNLIVFIRGLLI